jgi:hypothetical protein
MPFSRKEQTIRFENADEVATNLPSFGVPLIQGLRDKSEGRAAAESHESTDKEERGA